MIKALVNRILPFSSVDGPGNRTVIFLQGCNFNCKYCHNPETINNCTACGLCIPACPSAALDCKDGRITWDPGVCTGCDACLKACPGKSSPKTVYMTAEEVMKEVLKVRPFISGITVSGGECTLQKEFLLELIKRAHSAGLTVFLDTNGSFDFSKDDKLSASLDRVMLDIKAFDKNEHMLLTGTSNETVLNNAVYLGKRGKLYEVRTVIVPDLLDNIRNVSEISVLISGIDPGIRYKLIKFRPIGVTESMKSIQIPSDELLRQLKKIAEEKGCRNVIVV